MNHLFFRHNVPSSIFLLGVISNLILTASRCLSKIRPIKSHILFIFQIKQNKADQARIISSEIYLPTMFLNTLCDAYDTPLFQGNPRPLLRLHRKLAPYKISFAIPTIRKWPLSILNDSRWPSYSYVLIFKTAILHVCHIQYFYLKCFIAKKAVMEELRSLAMFLCKQLRANHVSCLLTPSSYKHTLDSQWKQYDEMGVPYEVILNENTLKNGIAQLRSRDTTLKEQIHVTDLSNYVQELFKNY